MKEHLTIAKFKPFYDTIFSQPSNKNPFNKVMNKKGYVIDNCSSRMLNFSGTTEKHPEV